MSQYQITYWKDIPSMVAAKDGDEIVKVMLHDRFQIAIDEAAMRLGSVDSGSYLENWHTTPWLEESGNPSDVAGAISKSLEDKFDEDALNQILDSIETENTQ